MLPALEPALTVDERDARFDAAAAQFAAPLARLAGALEDGHSGCEALLQDIHVALWRSFADYDAAIPLRTWVFRVALQAVANHQPNMQDKDLRTMPVREAWASRRRLAKLVSLDDLAIGELRSPTGLMHQLKPLDRELVVLYLEGMTAEEAVEIGGWPLARVQAAYERIGRLLLPGVREAWLQRSRDAQPVTRFLVHSRMGDLHKLRKREHGWPAFIVFPALMFVGLSRALTADRVRWFAAAGYAALAIVMIASAIKARRKFRRAPAATTDGRLDSHAFHRRMLERQLDELRERWGWMPWAALGAFLPLVLSSPLDRGGEWTVPIAFWVAALIGTAAYWAWGRREAKRLRARIHAYQQVAE